MKGRLYNEQLRQGSRQTTRARTNYYQLFHVTRLQLRPAGYNHPSTAPPLTNARRSPQGHRLYASPGFTGGQIATTLALPGSNHLPKADRTPVRSTGWTFWPRRANLRRGHPHRRTHWVTWTAVLPLHGVCVCTSPRTNRQLDAIICLWQTSRQEV